MLTRSCKAWKHDFKITASASSIAGVEPLLQKAAMVSDFSAALIEARERRGLNAPAIARSLGIAVQAVYQWEKGKTQPSPENIRKLAALLEISVGELFEGRVAAATPTTSGPPLAATTPRQDEASVELAPDAPSAASQVGRVRDVPELGIAVGGSDGDFSLNGETIGYVPRPLSLMKRDVFAVRVRSDSMSPRFEEGDLLYVERHRQPALGDDGVFEMYPEEEGQAGPAFIKRLVSKNMHTVVVRQFNPLNEITYERRKLKAMYRVVPNNELLGV